ncbi:MAG: PAS domain S-box protein [Deltaproteobacteria bacterium]|nr:PAS domain S-box protein [Deltaproteobacteria bacterium]
MGKVEDIESRLNDVCPVTGLPVLRKPEWTDVNFGKDYRVTVSIVGNNIFRVQPSGYVTLANQINVLKLTGQAPAEAISGGVQYVHIEDWSNFQGASLGARKHYMDEMQARKQILCVIFCNVPTMYNLSIKIGKAMRMVKFPVHLVNDYPEAVGLALEIQSKGNALEDKPAIAPSNKKDVPINVFPSDEESVCPVTSLPITTRPEWTHIPIDDNYSVSFSLIGNAILRVVPNGPVTERGTRRLIEARDKVLKDADLKGKQYAEIRDHSMITRKPSRNGRMLLTNLLLKETNEGNLVGFWVFNAPLSIRLMFDVGVRLHKPSVPVGAARDYREAAENAVDVLEQNGIDVGAKQYKRFAKDDWHFELDNYGVRFELIGDDIIYTVAHGSLKEADVGKFFDLNEKVLEEAGLTAKGSYYRIINWENLQKTTWKARKMYIDGVRDLNEKVPCKLSAVFGLNKFMKTIVGFSKQFIPIPVANARDFEEAMAIILREKKRGPETRISNMKRRTEEIAQDERIVNYRDELLEFMGAINWDQKGPAWEGMSDTHLFKPAYDALAIIKEDVDDLLQARKRAEETLEQRNRDLLFINQTTQTFNSVLDLDKVLEAVLSEVTQLMNVVGCSIWLTEPNTSELLCIQATGPHASVVRDWRQSFGEGFIGWVAQHGESLIVPDIRTDARHSGEVDLQTGLNIRSCLCAPIKVKGKLIGVIQVVDTEIERFESGHMVFLEPLAASAGIAIENARLYEKSRKEIDERKQAEETLRLSEARYRDIFENVSDYIYVHDLEGNFTEANLVWKKELGLTEGDLAHLNVRDLIPQRFKHQFDDYLDRVKAKGKDEGLMGLMTKEGDERTLEYKNSLIYGSTGPVGIRGSARDITEKLHGQSALRQSEEKYRTILENIEDGYFEVDLAGSLTFFNDALCRITGFPEDELMGMNNREYMDEETAGKVHEIYSGIYRTGDPIKGFEYGILTNGDPKHVETSVSLMKDRAGQPIGFRGILRDVSERKQAEEKIKQYSENLEEMVEKRTSELVESEEKYRTILENIEDGYYEVDFSGNLTFFNDAVCRISGYSEDELMGMNNRQYMDEENASKLYREYNKVYKTGMPSKRLDWEVIKKGEKTGFLESSISLVVDSEDQPMGFRGIVRDVTERKELEREILEKRRQAEEATKAKSQFLANMSHEIRTPLNGIIGMAELALDTKLDSNQKNIFHTINTEAGSLQDVINEILDFSKIEAGKFDLEEIPFDLRITIEDVANSFAYRAEQKGLDFISFLAPDVPSRLIGDPTRLRQIVVNLTGNALKFTREGELYIKGELVEMIGDRVKIRFSIKDTGIGIPKDKQATVFESFTQADGSTTRNYGGTGLGTTISKQLAEMMGGEIGLDSEVGKGSTFWFTALFGEQEEKKKIPAAIDLDLSNLKVLIIDDNQTNRFVLMEYLKSWGCLPVEAVEGKEALIVFRDAVSCESPFDLILTDFQMPEMSGFDLAKEIKTMEILKEVPIIVLTSSGRKGDSKSCKEIGVNGYLTKPIRQNELRKAIVSVLGLSTGRKAGSLPELVTRHSVAEDYRKEIQVLLVEDYPTNQQVAMRHLSRAGYQVDLAEDGSQAVKAYKRKNYNLIFMDIQMPIMDGYAATQEIRKIETRNLEQSTIQRVPIIAMTAHAMKGYRERCLETGMDDYIAKPLRRKELLTIAEKWTSGIYDCRLMPDDCIALRGNQESEAPMEYAKALEEFEGDEAFLMEVLEGFIGNVTSQIGIIREAISDGDSEIVRREAHSIKGGAANLTADELSKIAFELENIGRSGMLEEGIDSLQKLEREFFRLERFVAKRDDIN